VKQAINNCHCLPVCSHLQNAHRLKQAIEARLLGNRAERTALVTLRCRPAFCSPQRIGPVDLSQRKYPCYEENAAFRSTAICGTMIHIEFCTGVRYCTEELLCRFVKKLKDPDGKHTNLPRHTASSFTHSKHPHWLQILLGMNSTRCNTCIQQQNILLEGIFCSVKRQWVSNDVCKQYWRAGAV